MLQQYISVHFRVFFLLNVRFSLTCYWMTPKSLCLLYKLWLLYVTDPPLFIISAPSPSYSLGFTSFHLPFSPLLMKVDQPEMLNVFLSPQRLLDQQSICTSSFFSYVDYYFSNDRNYIFLSTPSDSPMVTLRLRMCSMRIWDFILLSKLSMINFMNICSVYCLYIKIYNVQNEGLFAKVKPAKLGNIG